MVVIVPSRGCRGRGAGSFRGQRPHKVVDDVVVVIDHVASGMDILTVNHCSFITHSRITVLLMVVKPATTCRLLRTSN